MARGGQRLASGVVARRPGGPAQVGRVDGHCVTEFFSCCVVVAREAGRDEAVRGGFGRAGVALGGLFRYRGFRGGPV